MSNTQPTQSYRRPIQQQASQLLNNPRLVAGVDFYVKNGIGYMLTGTQNQVNHIVTGK